MNIADELRKYASDATTRKDYMTGLAFDLNRIADRIDAKHEEELLSARNHGYELGCEDAYDAAYHAAYQDGENAILAVFDKRGNSDVDERMAEHGWYRALDADKEVIHADDELFWKEDGVSAGRVTAIGIRRRAGWVWTLTDGGCVSVGHVTSLLCHHHSPTVEDVLDEFVERWHDTYHDDIPALKAEYAAKLRLAGDAE